MRKAKGKVEPPYADSKKTLDILWFADRERDAIWNMNWVYERDAWERRHNVTFWGPGRDGFDPRIPVKEVSKAYFGEKGPDLVVFALWYLCCPPTDAASIDVPKVMFVEDNYRQCRRGVADFASRYRIDAIFHRYFTGISELINVVSNRCGHEPPLIHTPWAVDKDVFCPSISQPHDVSILGQYSRRYYPWRYEVFRKIQQSLLKYVWKPHPGAFKPRGNRREKTSGSVVGSAYAEALASAKVGITTGGGVGYAVARHFEIPSCNSTLVCNSTWELENLGFKKGIHYYVLDIHDPVGQVESILADEHERRRVTTTARSMILERHTWDHRVEECTAALQREGIL